MKILFKKKAVNCEDGNTQSETSEMASDDDMIRFSETCLVLSFMTKEATTKTLTLQDTNKKTKKDEAIKFQFNNQPFKLPNDHFLFERLTQIICGQFINTNTIYWTPMVENALQCIFKLG